MHMPSTLDTILFDLDGTLIPMDQDVFLHAYFSRIQQRAVQLGLDPAASHLLKGYLAELCAAGGAVFFSTHVLEVAEKLCHRIAIIKDGRLVRQGATAELVGDSTLEEVFLELEGASQP